MNGVGSIMDLLQGAGAQRYGGEAVSQLEHALQCAQWAEADSAAPELVVAALLHDLGHLLHDPGETPAAVAPGLCPEAWRLFPPSAPSLRSPQPFSRREKGASSSPLRGEVVGLDATRQGVDDKHQFRAMHLLRRVFGSAVTEPIRMHVDAKRYWCRADAAYYEALSPASKASLELQGGVFSAGEARRFIVQPYGRDAARLRTWDDHAKTPGKPTPPLAHYEKIMARCVKR